MPFPAPGKYRLFLPPIPFGLDIEVKEEPKRMEAPPPLGMFPYSEPADAFSINQDSMIECLGNGAWKLTKLVPGGPPATISGTCTPIP